MLQTYQTKIKADNTEYLNEAATFIGFLERKLFVLLFIYKMDRNKCKTEFMKKYRITSRQYNAILIILEGKINSNIEKRKYDIDLIKDKIKSVERYISLNLKKRNRMHDSILEIKNQQDKISAKLLKQYKNLKFKLHHKKRKLYQLKQRLAQLLDDEENQKLRICFGSRKLFKKQFNLKLNKYKNFTEWKEDWVEARNKTVYCLGSKDETSGNQSCVYNTNNKTLSLRVMNQFIDKYGKYILFNNISFPYGQENIENGLKTYIGLTKSKRRIKYCKSAISYRFIRKAKGWYVQASVNIDIPEICTKNRVGCIGIDLNVNFISLCEVDRFGNPIKQRRIKMNTYHRRSEQVEATIGDVVKEIVSISIMSNKSIAIEKLDFKKKKATLGEESKKYSRMLSGFAYKNFYTLLKARAQKYGAEVIEVNPAYSSIIGQIKYMKRYGLSSHSSAACVIARRGMNFKIEKPKIINPLGKFENQGTRMKTWIDLAYKVKNNYTFKKRIELLLAN